MQIPTRRKDYENVFIIIWKNIFGCMNMLSFRASTFEFSHLIGLKYMVLGTGVIVYKCGKSYTTEQFNLIFHFKSHTIEKSHFPHSITLAIAPSHFNQRISLKQNSQLELPSTRVQVFIVSKLYQKVQRGIKYKWRQYSATLVDILCNGACLLVCSANVKGIVTSWPR